MPCPACGASVAVALEAEHACDPGRLLDFELFQLRAEIGGLGAEIDDYLSSVQGRFEQWYAEHERRHGPTDDLQGQPSEEPTP